MNIFDELKLRNIVNNVTNEEKLKNFIEKKGGVYIGFDPSFRSLHLGNYVMIVTLKKINLAGFKTVALIGGATGLIGDPSGKKAERTVQAEKTIKQNSEAITRQIEKYSHSKVVNNIDIYGEMTIFTFLRDIGKLINVNYLLEKDIIKNRLETGISYSEFSYNLIQGYDFLHLYKTEEVWMQMGGSDQWGNITTGIEMIRKTISDSNNALGVTINLLTKNDGTKFGKSEQGAIYLDPEITSPYQMYQFLINQSDDDVKNLLNCITFLSLEEIDKVMTKHNENRSVYYAQKRLAQEVVTDIHGATILTKCQKISEALFNNEAASLPTEDLYEALQGVPTFNTTASEYSIIDLVVSIGISPSKSNARTLVQSKAISVNGKTIDDINFVVKKENGFDKKFSFLRKGKKNYFLVNWK